MSSLDRASVNIVELAVESYDFIRQKLEGFEIERQRFFGDRFGARYSLQRIARTKAIVEDPIPLDLERFKTLSDEVVKLNSKLNYVYGGTVK